MGYHDRIVSLSYIRIVTGPVDFVIGANRDHVTYCSRPQVIDGNEIQDEWHHKK